MGGGETSPWEKSGQRGLWKRGFKTGGKRRLSPADTKGVSCGGGQGVQLPGGKLRTGGSNRKTLWGKRRTQVKKNHPRNDAR